MKKQRKLFYQIVNAIIICSILITVLVSSIILNNSMYNVNSEAEEKFQYLVSDIGHQIDIQIASSESVIKELNSSVFNIVDWRMYEESVDYRSKAHVTIEDILSASANRIEYVYDYYVVLGSGDEAVVISSSQNSQPDDLLSLLNQIDLKPNDRGLWLNFNDDPGLFHYVEPFCINNEQCGYIGGRFRQNSFLWGIYDPDLIFTTDAWLMDPLNGNIVMNHSLPGTPLRFSEAHLEPTYQQSRGLFEMKNGQGKDIIVAFSHLRNQWLVLIGMEKKQILSRSYELINMLIMLVIIGSIFSVFIASSISERIIDPIEIMLTEVNRISSGDLYKPIPDQYLSYENEIGALAISIEHMRVRIQNYIQEIESHAQSLENEVFYQTAELMAANEQLQDTIRIMKHKDEELTQTNEELEQTLENLKDTQTELVKSQKLAALSSLVRGISHKLNTPVGTSITSLSYMIQELKAFFINVSKESDSIKAYHQDMYDLIDTGNLTMTNLMKTRDILDTLKDITSDSMTEKKHQFNLSRMMMELVSSIRVRSEYHHHMFSTEIEDDIWVDSYPSVFTQVITHLIANSVIHGFKDLDSGTIHVEMYQLGNYVEIIYSDNGVGISKDAMDKIFDPFYTTDLGNQTSGLGLSVIYNQINLKLGGNIICDQTFTKGTRFKIRIPLV